MRKWERTWHLIFLAHVWALSPFAFIWLYQPSVARDLSPDRLGSMRLFTLGMLAYFAIRTVVAFKDPKWFKWEYVYPPIDVLLVTVMLALGDQDPLGNITIMYFLPIAEAAGTLNVVYAGAIGVLSVGGCVLGSLNLAEKPWNVAFRFVFIFVMASLFSFLARMAAEFRAKAQVAADRNRLALEMHDGVQAQLISAASQMELVQHLAPRDARRASDVAQESRGTLRQAADELRFLVQRMRAPAMGEGFLPALKQYAHNFCERFGLAFEFEAVGRARNLVAEQENVLFRIVQESLTNVVKHAGARTVELCIRFDADEVLLTIADDGCGIGSVETCSGVGLQSMRERASRVGGAVKVERGEKGTRIEARIPLKMVKVKAVV